MGCADYIYLKLLTPSVYSLSKSENIGFGSNDLARMAAEYNDMKPSRKAPLVIGHPENDTPQYGAVELLNASDKALMAVATIDSEAFRKSWSRGNYVRHAAQFYAPENPKNPKPGTWFLKHVGFRGAPAPIVRGFLTTDAEFAESLTGNGRLIEEALRFGGRAAPEFVQYATFPRKPDDLAQLAHAVIAYAARSGESIDIYGALKVVCPWAVF